MKILNANEFYDIMNETFPHDVISKNDILNLIEEMTQNFIMENIKMKFRDYDMSLLIKECEDFIDYIDSKELDNNCCMEEQLLINAVSDVLLAFNIVNKKSN